MVLLLYLYLYFFQINIDVNLNKLYLIYSQATPTSSVVKGGVGMIVGGCRCLTINKASLESFDGQPPPVKEKKSRSYTVTETNDHLWSKRTNHSKS